MKQFMFFSIAVPIAGFWVQFARGFWLDSLLMLGVLGAVIAVWALATPEEEIILPGVSED